MKPASVAIFFLIVLTAYTGVNLYLGKRIFQSVCAFYPKANAVLFTAIYLIAATALIVLNFANLSIFPTAARGVLRWASACWMGFFFYALLLFLAADAVITVGRVVKAIPYPVPQYIRLYVGLAVMTLTVALITYGIINANDIKITSYSVRLNNNKTLTGGMKIVLVSDLHIGAADSEKRLPKIIDAINDQKPDLICISGDIFNNDYYAISNPEKASALFKRLRATHGVYACLGNHDAGKSVEEMIDFLERSNVKLLNDAFDIVNGQAVLVGRLDSRPIGGYNGMRRAGISEIIMPTNDGKSIVMTNVRGEPAGRKRQSTVDRSMPIIVIDHNPKSIHEYGRWVDLVLSGHTHRGQLFPVNLLTKAVYTADYGHYQKEPGATNLIVTSGAGIWGPPMRVGTHSEIVCISLY